MKRTVCIVCLLALLLSACSIEEQIQTTPTIPEGDYDYGIYQLTFTENKISNDHVGTGTLTVAICDVGAGKTKITVTENAGAFKGNAAVWEVSCEVKLVSKQ